MNPTDDRTDPTSPSAPTAARQEAAPPGRPKLRTLFRLQWEPAQDAFVLLYPEGMVKLNQSAAEILKRCDGTREVAALVAELEQAFTASGLAPEIEAFLAEATRRGWLE